MAANTRVRIGLIFSYWANWIGGSYYIINLIEALKTLPTHQQPHICLFVYEQKDSEIVKKLHYPFISYHLIDDAPTYNSNGYNIVERLLNQISLSLRGYLYIDKRPVNLTLLFPNPPHLYYFEHIPKSKQIYWIPDFQEKYLPHLFDEEELNRRASHHRVLVNKKLPLVFSSFAALNDFKTFYPDTQNRVWILQFAVTHEPYAHLNTADLLQKFALPTHYFFAPNQFWVHKNHIVVIKAIELLKAKGIECVVAFSGKEYDNRNPNYTEDLKQYVKEHQLQDNIKFLGFIDRSEQLKLMKEAVAIIQPSLFEGWSTVVEDAKAMNQCIIASDLSVHREQLADEGNFFNPHQPESLAVYLEALYHQKSLPRYTKNYSQKVQEFALNFMNIVSEVSNYA